MGDEQHPLVLGLDHVQLAMPAGEEARAAAFYGGVLGLEPLPKPAALAGRGGLWFRCGAAALHLGVEAEFRPQRKAHPALRVRDLAAARARLTAAGYALAEDAPLPGVVRCFTTDPFGNRLELLQPLAEAEARAVEAEAVKDRVRDVFGAAAEAYVASPGHASGDDLARLVELLAPTASDRALDLSTGGGHTALALAAHAGHVVASDLTPRMLAAARAHLTAQGATNVTYVVADAERLPFLDASFDLVTVRIAPHHYADIRAAVREMARVLRPGGRLGLVDNIAPEQPHLDALLNAWEQARDPSHVRAYCASEWRHLLAEAGLDVTVWETGRKTHAFAPWAARTHMPADRQRALAAEMLAAPPDALAYFQITRQGDHVTSWSAEYLLTCAVRTPPPQA